MQNKGKTNPAETRYEFTTSKEEKIIGKENNGNYHVNFKQAVQRFLEDIPEDWTISNIECMLGQLQKQIMKTKFEGIHLADFQDMYRAANIAENFFRLLFLKDETDDNA